jgi:hypothetical protein
MQCGDSRFCVVEKWELPGAHDPCVDIGVDAEPCEWDAQVLIEVAEACV